ncbi:hypothetical protein AU255_04850 [Methyloprofundus sedimenti]|uniref:Uncharacterized protein n=1 Tax=Methyloprofundus sedimenti TaxID=1420851 RepID=A0A1V8M6M0_9GAMM|nr:hypothetical protein AU255_04850 [Methyloprofundus sedimenti]
MSVCNSLTKHNKTNTFLSLIGCYAVREKHHSQKTLIPEPDILQDPGFVILADHSPRLECRTEITATVCAPGENWASAKQTAFEQYLCALSGLYFLADWALFIFFAMPFTLLLSCP